MSSGAAHRGREHGKKPSRYDCSLALTAAFKTGDRELLVKVFKETLRAQENVAEFAGKNDQDA
jgi:hypothetical protein